MFYLWLNWQHNAAQCLKLCDLKYISNTPKFSYNFLGHGIESILWKNLKNKVYCGNLLFHNSLTSIPI